MPAVAEQRAPAVEVGARALVRVIAVDEEQVERLHREIDRPRVPDDERDAAIEPVPLQGLTKLAVEIRAGTLAAPGARRS